MEYQFSPGSGSTVFTESYAKRIFLLNFFVTNLKYKNISVLGLHIYKKKYLSQFLSFFVQHFFFYLSQK